MRGKFHLVKQARYAHTQTGYAAAFALQPKAVEVLCNAVHNPDRPQLTVDHCPMDKNECGQECGDVIASAPAKIK